MMYAIFRDDKIESILCGQVSEDLGAVPIPDDFRGTVGMHREEFRDDWSVRTLAERVSAGYVQPPKGWRAEGDAFVEMTQAEKYREGVEPIPDGMILDGDTLRSMTRAELVAAGQLTQAEADELTAREVRAERDRLLSACDWTQVADAPVDRSAWAAYRQALRDVPEQAGFPYTITWPEEPGKA